MMQSSLTLSGENHTLVGVDNSHQRVFSVTTDKEGLRIAIKDQKSKVKHWKSDEDARLLICVPRQGRLISSDGREA